MRVPLLFLSTVLCVACGVGLLAAHARHNATHAWRPVRVALPVTAGAEARATFVAELDDDYEIELEFSGTLPDEVAERVVEPVEQPSPIDVRWQILTRGEQIASGDARDYLYLTAGGYGALGRWRRTLLGDPFHRMPGGTMERGIGSFAAKQGETYEVRAQVGATLPELENASPHLAVRIRRATWLRHYAEMQTAAQAGFVFLGIGGTLGLIWLGRLVLRRRLKNRSSSRAPA